LKQFNVFIVQYAGCRSIRIVNMPRAAKAPALRYTCTFMCLVNLTSRPCCKKLINQRSVFFIMHIYKPQVDCWKWG